MKPIWIGKYKSYFYFFVFSLVFSFFIYANTFSNGWTYDDFPVIVKNPDIQSISGFFRNTYPGRPLREISFLLDFYLFGINPAGWHVQQIFWHALTGFLVLFVGVRLGIRFWLSALCATLFLLHPIQVEAVANLSHRKESLQLAFSLLSFLAYMSACDDLPGRVRWLSLASCSALLAFFAKEQAIVLLPLFTGYELAMVPRERRLIARDPRWVAGLLVAGVTGFMLWFFLFGGKELFIAQYPGHLIKMNIHQGTLLTYVLMVLKSWAFMAGKFFLPLQLGVEYVFPAPRSWLDPWVSAGMALFLGYFLSLYIGWRWHRPLFVVLLWIGLFWLPVSHVWPFSAYLAADRYLYVVSAGVLLAIGAIFEKLPFRVGVAVLLLVSAPWLCVLTWNQSQVWKDDLSLFTHAVRVSPTSSAALTGLGGAYLLKGDLDQAIAPLQVAVTNWNQPLSYLYLGHIYEKKGEVEKAIQHYCFYVKSKGQVSNLMATKKDIGKYLLERYGTECR